MKQACSALFFCATICLIIGAFGFGRHVSSLSSSAPLQQANALAVQQAKKNHWTVEALGGSMSRTMTVPGSTSSVELAADDTDSGGGSGLYGSDSPLITFQQVYELLKEQYVDRIPSDTPLAHGAVSALIASLDEPNSRFLDPGERAAVENEDKGKFAGTGIVFTVRKVLVEGLLERQLTVIDPVVGSPADKAGLKTGDVITDINGHWVVSFDPFAAEDKLFKKLSSDPVSFNHAVDATEAKIKDGLTLPQAQELLDTTQAAPLDLSITRGTQSLKISLDGSQTTSVTDVNSKVLSDGNGYIQVNAFIDTTDQSFQKAFAAVSTAPGVVIDLRNCPGGPIDPALTIGQELAANVPIGTVDIRDSHGTYDKSVGFATKSEQLNYDPQTGGTIVPINYTGRIAVLVNNGTANTAELLAAFLHDRLGAHIIGTTTFGDGMAQTLFPLSDGSGYLLTTGQVKTTTDNAFEAKGISPDVPLAQADANGDSAIASAEQTLTTKPVNVSTTASTSGGQKS